MLLQCKYLGGVLGNVRGCVSGDREAETRQHLRAIFSFRQFWFIHNSRVWPGVFFLMTVPANHSRNCGRRSWAERICPRPLIPEPNQLHISNTEYWTLFDLNYGSFALLSQLLTQQSLEIRAWRWLPSEWLCALWWSFVFWIRGELNETLVQATL